MIGYRGQPSDPKMDYVRAATSAEARTSLGRDKDWPCVKVAENPDGPVWELPKDVRDRRVPALRIDVPAVPRSRGISR
jgi:hypothetical protein